MSRLFISWQPYYELLKTKRRDKYGGGGKRYITLNLYPRNATGHADDDDDDDDVDDDDDDDDSNTR